MKTIYHNGNAVLMFDEAMAELGLVQHQEVDDATHWQCIAANAAHLGAVMARETDDPAFRKRALNLHHDAKALGACMRRQKGNT